LKNFDEAYGPMLQQSLVIPGGYSGKETAGINFKDQYADRLALQRHSIALVKKQISNGLSTMDDVGDSGLPNVAYQPV